MTIEELKAIDKILQGSRWEYKEFPGLQIPEYVVAILDSQRRYTIAHPVHTNPQTRANMQGIATMRNHFSGLLRVAAAAKDLLADLDGAEIEGKPSDELRASLRALEDEG